MRPAAQIDEFSLPIERHRRVIFQPGIDVLHLEILAQLLAQLQRLVARLFQPLERLISLDDLGHLGLDLRKIFLRERPRQHHVVIKPAAHRRPERQLHAGKHPHHGPGHHVGTRVPHHAQAPRHPFWSESSAPLRPRWAAAYRAPRSSRRSTAATAAFARPGPMSAATSLARMC